MTRSRILVGAIAAGALLAPASAHAVTLSNGHVDAVAARIVGGKLRAFVKDETSGRTRWRSPSSVVIGVNDRARVRLPSGLGVVGRAGQTVWMIPQVQRPGVVWAGWNTESIRGGSVRWTLRGVRGPGRMVLFQTGSFGAANVLFSSARGMPQRVSVPGGTHAHGNWAFTQSGTYRLRYGLQRGSRRTSATLTFRVG